MDPELEALQRAVETMPDRIYQVFTRSRHRGLDYHQIAEELGITVPEVERRVADAIRHLMRNVPETRDD